MSSPLTLPFTLAMGVYVPAVHHQRVGGRAGKAGGYKMRKSQLGSRSRFGRVRGTPRVINPWGKPLSQTSVGRTTATGQSTRKGRAPSSSSRAKSTPDASLFGMSYKRNDPLAWPVEVPTATSQLLFDKVTTSKANFNNTVVNKAFQRGGYAG